jgi:cell wall-associated NlpC family hydrolase
MFFLSRRGTIAHTGIYLGDGKYIEAAEPVVKISTWDEVPPERDHPRTDSFCFAKRVFE